MRFRQLRWPPLDELGNSLVIGCRFHSQRIASSQSQADSAATMISTHSYNRGFLSLSLSSLVLSIECPRRGTWCLGDVQSSAIRGVGTAQSSGVWVKALFIWDNAVLVFWHCSQVNTTLAYKTAAGYRSFIQNDYVIYSVITACQAKFILMISYRHHGDVVCAKVFRETSVKV